jgi:methylglyoxal synthase
MERTTLEMEQRKKIALVAHDNKKRDLLEWAAFNRELLADHELCATGTTGKVLREELGLEVAALQSGPLGGDQQIGGKIAEGDIDFLIFFWDPLKHQAGVDPIGATASNRLAEQELALRRDRELAHASAPIMAEARNLLAQSGTIMVIADPTGVVLETEGDQVTRDAAADVSLVEGADWSERSRGTNGVGTALSASGPVQIHGSEHYCAAIKHWTCTATVVRDPIDRDVLLALSVSGLSTAFNQHLLALAVATAARIETALAARELERRQRLLEHGQRQASTMGPGALLLFDRKGRLIKADARAELPLALTGNSANGAIRISALDLGQFEHGPTAKLPDWLHADRMAPVIQDGERLGTVAVLSERLWHGAVLPEGSLPGHKLRRVSEFIEAHIDQPIRLRQLAATAGVSPFHFHRQFRRATGLTPHQYTVQRRIEHAKLLLSTSELPLVEVAARVGFSDQSRFTTTFRRMMSTTPGNYRSRTLE